MGDVRLVCVDAGLVEEDLRRMGMMACGLGKILRDSGRYGIRDIG